MPSTCSLSRPQQLDIFSPPGFWSDSLQSAAERIGERLGMGFDEWVRLRLSEGASVRDMAEEAGVRYHATLWRWIRRRMPDLNLKGGGGPRLSEEQIAAVAAVWRGEGITNPGAIAERTGLPVDLVGKAKKAWQRRSGERTRDLHRMLSTKAWVPTQLKRGERNSGW